MNTNFETDEYFSKLAQSFINRAGHNNPAALGRLIYYYGQFKATQAKLLQAHASMEVQSSLKILAEQLHKENEALLAELDGSAQKLDSVFDGVLLPN